MAWLQLKILPLQARRDSCSEADNAALYIGLEGPALTGPGIRTDRARGRRRL